MGQVLIGGNELNVRRRRHRQRHPSEGTIEKRFPCTWTPEHHRAEHEAPLGNQLHGDEIATIARKNGHKLPDCLEMVEVNAIAAVAPNPGARLIMLEQWRAGLRVSGALTLEARNLHLDSDRPKLVVRQGKGTKRPGGPGPSEAADYPDRGHQLRDRWSGQVDRGIPCDGLKVGPTGGPPGH